MQIFGIAMIELSNNISTPEMAREFIMSCEKSFFTELDNAVVDLMRGNDKRIIALSGPTCSGKTTTAARLIKEINDSGHQAVVLSIDDFFRDREYRNRVDLEAPDYDSVKAIDLAYLQYFIGRLMEGKSVLIPKYSFTETARVGYNEYIPKPHDIYVIEGIQAVYPEITSMFKEYGYKSVFISVTDDVCYRGTVVPANDIRLARRIVRDYKFRGAIPEFSFHLWHGVRDNEERNIFPNSKSCDVYINSFLPYELFVIQKFALPLLDGVPADSEYRDEADELSAKLSVFRNDLFDDRMIPNNSVFREFIG